LGKGKVDMDFKKVINFTETKKEKMKILFFKSGSKKQTETIWFWVILNLS